MSPHLKWEPQRNEITQFSPSLEALSSRKCNLADAKYNTREANRGTVAKGSLVNAALIFALSPRAVLHCLTVPQDWSGEVRSWGELSFKSLLRKFHGCFFHPVSPIFWSALRWI